MQTSAKLALTVLLAEVKEGRMSCLAFSTSKRSDSQIMLGSECRTNNGECSSSSYYYLLARVVYCRLEYTLQMIHSCEGVDCVKRNPNSQEALKRNDRQTDESENQAKPSSLLSLLVGMVVIEIIGRS
jgi:hypothetical protein